MDSGVEVVAPCVRWGDHVMSRTGWLVVTILLAMPFCSWAAENSQKAEQAKPECTAKLRGKLWPEKTSRGADVPVEICAPKRFHYEWKQLTVDVSQLKATTKPAKVVAALPGATVGRKGVLRAE